MFYFIQSIQSIIISAYDTATVQALSCHIWGAMVLDSVALEDRTSWFHWNIAFSFVPYRLWPVFPWDPLVWCPSWKGLVEVVWPFSWDEVWEAMCQSDTYSQFPDRWLSWWTLTSDKQWTAVGQRPLNTLCVPCPLSLLPCHDIFLVSTLCLFSEWWLF